MDVTTSTGIHYNNSCHKTIFKQAISQVMTCLSSLNQMPSLKRKRCGDLPRNITDDVDSTLPPRKVIRVVPTSASNSKATTTQNPQHALVKIFEKRGSTTKSRSYESFPNAFVTLPKDLGAWNFDILAAVRTGNLEQLKVLHLEGHNMKCTNRFGETLLHLACRKGLVTVVEFLLVNVGMPANIHDDTGRTPLHDAFWTPEPNPKLVELMLSQSPEMLLVQDKRGHCPLQYSRQAHWKTWNDFLESPQTQLELNRL